MLHPRFSDLDGTKHGTWARKPRGYGLGLWIADSCTGTEAWHLLVKDGRSPVCSPVTACVRGQTTSDGSNQKRVRSGSPVPFERCAVRSGVSRLFGASKKRHRRSHPLRPDPWKLSSCFSEIHGTSSFEAHSLRVNSNVALNHMRVPFISCQAIVFPNGIQLWCLVKRVRGPTKWHNQRCTIGAPLWSLM